MATSCSPIPRRSAIVTLSITSGLTTVDLGTFDTTSFSDGSDTITVTATDQSSQPLPTATGVSSVTIGSPVTATLTVSPPILPIGTSTVTDTLQINSSIPLTDPLTVDGQTATTPATTVALYQDSVDSLTLAYVAGPNGIDIVNVSNPAAPVDEGTFGQSDLVAGRPHRRPSGHDQRRRLPHRRHDAAKLHRERGPVQTADLLVGRAAQPATGQRHRCLSRTPSTASITTAAS